MRLFRIILLFSPFLIYFKFIFSFLIIFIAGASLAYFSTILDKKLNQENEKGVQPQESQTPDTEIRIE